MSGMNLSKAEGYVLLAGAALVVYAAYKAYMLAKDAADAAKGVADNVRQTVQDAYKTAKNFTAAGTCGMCVEFPAVCDFFNPTWMEDNCLYVQRDLKTLDRSQQTGPTDPAVYDPSLSLGPSAILTTPDVNPNAVTFDKFGMPVGGSNLGLMAGG